MKLTLVYVDGSTVTLEHVAMLEFVGPMMVDVRCFGNETVRHRDVQTVKPEAFSFVTRPMPDNGGR